ncbi:MAG TPA: helix-turn-helix transcriptional regulator [Thermoanaerobaculia bacterium]|nr:helix-turn-helix transcriptional regulator [Thermoanaerobaculia bacterium]
MPMFRNVGPTLALCRQLKGWSQRRLAREAGIGPSQLSKYECGREDPKLASLEALLKVMDLGAWDFFCALALIDGLETVATTPSNVRPSPALLPKLPGGSADEAFHRLVSDLLALHRALLEQRLEAMGGLQREEPAESTE